MKRLLQISAVLSTLALPACESEFDVNSSDQKERRLTIELVQDGSATRGTALSTETKISTIDVLIFDSRNNILVHRTVDATENEIDTISLLIRETQCQIFAFANVSDQIDLENVKTIAELSALNLDLTQINLAGKGIPMSAENREVRLSSEVENVITLDLERYLARVNFEWKIALDNTLGNENLKVDEAFIINGTKKLGVTTIEANDTLAESEFIMGGELQAPDGIENQEEFDYFITENDSDLEDNKEVFYLLPNVLVENTPSESSYGATKVVLGCTYTNSSTNKKTKFYYPITINEIEKEEKDQPFLVNRNTAYKVTVNIKGLGTENPWNPVAEKNIEVKLTIEDWKEVNQDVTFGPK